MAVLRRGPPNGSVECRWCGQKFAILYEYLAIAGVRTTATVDRAVYRTDRHASVNLVYRNQYGQPQRREENETI